MRHNLRTSAATTVSLALAAGFLITGCSHPATSCSGDLHPYKGKCLSNTAIVYVGCTEGRGSSSGKDLSGGIGGSFKVVANASIKAAFHQTRTEDTPVALQIVHDCLKLAEAASDTDSDRAAATSDVSKVSLALTSWQQKQVAETPHITLSTSRAAVGHHVTVSGVSFWPNETVDVRVGADLVAQVKVGANGRFTTRITVPTDAPPPGFPSPITVSGESSSKSATAPFHT